MSEHNIAVLGIDLGKNSVSLAGLDAAGAVVARKRTTREDAIKFAAKLAPCIVAMEACCGAHFMGRILGSQGHTIRLMSPKYVKPYVKAQKNDDRDAEAIAEAATRPTMRFVTPKSEAQLDLQTIHRVRDRPVMARTALTNQLRAILLDAPTHCGYPDQVCRTRRADHRSGRGACGRCSPGRVRPAPGDDPGYWRHQRDRLGRGRR